MKKITLFIIKTLVPASLFCSQLVDINSADVAQIALLPGIGKKLAENIVIFRESRGPLLHARDLLKVPGLTEKKLKNIDKAIVFLQKKTKNTAHQKSLDSIKISLPIKPLITLSSLESHILKAQGLDQAFDRSLKTRVRKAALLPKLSAYVDFDRGDLTTERKVLNASDSLLMRGGRDIGIGFRATFDLDKLIYNGEELEVAKLSLRRLEIRDQIIKKTQENYFRYVRLHDSAQKPLDVAIADATMREMAEIEAVLDSLSNGKFTQYMMEGVDKGLAFLGDAP